MNSIATHSEVTTVMFDPELKMAGKAPFPKSTLILVLKGRGIILFTTLPA